MKTTIKSILLVSGALLALCAAPASAYWPTSFNSDEVSYLKDRYHLSPDFTDEQLLQAAVKFETDDMAKTNGLQFGWTRAQYAEAAAERRLAEYRQQYGLKPGFTAADWANNAASQDLAIFLNSHRVKTGFTELDLLTATGEHQAKIEGYWVSAGKTETTPFDHAHSAAEYAAVSGPRKSQDIATEYHLPDAWTYDDLRAEAGPKEAATVAQMNGFHAGMTHDEIVTAIGLTAAKNHAKLYKLPTDYSGMQLVIAYGEEAVRDIRHDLSIENGETVNEATVFAHYHAIELRNLHYKFGALGSNFTEDQLRQYLINDEGEKLRSLYDLPQDYTQDDEARAYAESVVAQLRHDYKLPKHFRESDLANAIKAHPAWTVYDPI